MDLQTLSLIISIGAVLGTGVATFFAQRKNASSKVKDEIIDDQERRILQLEGERERNQKTLADQEDRIKQLENEKTLPLTKLTTLIIENNKQHTALLNTIVELLKENK
jgi:flagellar motility protein MotE (MotC chaperone)